MKKKLIVGMILIIFSFSIVLNFYKVEAFSEELDPENYIILPSSILAINSIAKCTISLASNASGYTISYQKVDIQDSTYNTIKNKQDSLNNYVEECNVTLEEKQASVRTLETEYRTLVNSGTATEEEITDAQNQYNAAYEDYQEFYDTAFANITTLKNDYYSSIPSYTDSWITTTNTSDNVQLDFTNYSGQVNFVLWAKIENGTNTYYDMNIYTTDIQQEEANEPETSTGTTDSDEGDWTDFSNSKFELKKEGVSDAIIEISNVTPRSESSYYLFITSDASKPNVTTEDSDKYILLSYDSDSKKLITNNLEKVAKNVELNQDLYVTIIEMQRDNKNQEDIVIYGKKLQRYEEPKYSDAFLSTFVSYNDTQIVTTFTHAKENNRKIQIKVGKITDVSILQKIKNQDSSGFADLLSFAKSNQGIYNEKLDADKDSSFAIQYTTRAGNEIIDLKGLQNDGYYFLYVKADDENGKYISQEAVTLGQAEIVDSSLWNIHFYGASEFQWVDFGNVEGDYTIAKGELPNTGIRTVILAVLGFVLVGGGVSYKLYKRNNF